MLALGYSTQRQHYGEQVHWMLITLDVDYLGC
jgi:trimethylamine-N-oxide reductase (cytochrome c)